MAAPVYAGVSLDIFFVHLDLQGMYELVSQSFGVDVGLRVQFD